MKAKKEIIFHVRKPVLIGLITPDLTDDLVSEYLLELDFLLEHQATTIKQFTQKLPHPDNKTFLEEENREVRQFVEDNEIDIIIFDDEFRLLNFEM